VISRAHEDQLLDDGVCLLRVGTDQPGHEADIHASRFRIAQRAEVARRLHHRRSAGKIAVRIIGIDPDEHAFLAIQSDRRRGPVDRRRGEGHARGQQQGNQCNAKSSHVPARASLARLAS
jgi:hypothetical protein